MNVSAGPAETIDWRLSAGLIRGRLIEPSDRELYPDLYASPEVMAQIGPVMSVAAAMTTFEQALRHSHDPEARARYWRLSVAPDDAAVGVAALVRQTRSPTHAEIGVMLLPQAQGRRVGVTALAAVTEGVVTQRWRLRIDRLIIHHTPANGGAAGIARALGFECRSGEGADPVEWWLDPSTWHRRGYAAPMTRTPDDPVL